MQMGEANAMVATCHVIECAYNMRDCCHAPDITVGDTHPMCDTFTTSTGARLAQSDAHVGGCMVSQCTFNNSMSCGAPGITLDYHGGHADGETYRPE